MSSLAPCCSPRNTHSSTFRSRESHHTSLTTGTGGACGSGATILTSGTLGAEGTEIEVRTEGGHTGGQEGVHREPYSQGGQFCHQDRGCQGFQSDPGGGRGRHEPWGPDDGGEYTRTPHPRPAWDMQGPGRARLMGWVSPWHQAGRLHRGGQLHQGNLWGQQGQGNRVRQQDPGWEKSQEVRDSGLGLVALRRVGSQSRWALRDTGEHWRCRYEAKWEEKEGAQAHPQQAVGNGRGRATPPAEGGAHVPASATKRTHLGTSHAICTREASASGSTLREERRPMSSEAPAQGYQDSTWG